MVTSLSGIVDNCGFNLSQFSNLLNSLDNSNNSSWVLENNSWSNWNWGRDLMNGSSDVNNLLGDSSNSLSQDDDFTSNNWSFWLWESW